MIQVDIEPPRLLHNAHAGTQLVNSVVQQVPVEDLEAGASGRHEHIADRIFAHHLVESKALVQNGVLVVDDRRAQLLAGGVLGGHACHLSLHHLLGALQLEGILGVNLAPGVLYLLLQLRAVLSRHSAYDLTFSVLNFVCHLLVFESFRLFVSILGLECLH